MAQSNVVERTARSRPKRASERFCENVESLAVAIVLALLIRHFVIQPFLIPTGSMKPTLYGEESFGDRILVDMYSYKVADPKRWEVVVFRYPLNRGMNFVKRLVGLPGEHVQIKNGDVYVNEAIERKPRAIQNGLWPHWPVYEFASNFRAAWEESGNAQWTAGDDDWRVAASGEALLKWKGAAMLRDPHTFATRLIGDRRIRFDCRLEQDRGEIVAEIREGPDVIRCRLGSKGSGSGVSVSVGDEVVARRPDLTLEPHRWYTVAFGNPDEQIQLDVDGDPVVYEPYRSAAGAADSQSIALGASSTEAAFRDVEIHRDLYHESTGSSDVRIPAGSYFMLGDNTLESKDSRLWYTVTIRTPEGGTAVVDKDDVERLRLFPAGGPREIVDRFGEVYRVSGAPEIVGPPEPSPFVARHLLLGRAFFVFFPLWRTDPFRINWRGVH